MANPMPMLPDVALTLAIALTTPTTPEYRRTTFLLPHEAARMTVDVDVSVSLPGGQPVRLDDVAVVETKGGHHPTAADRMLWALGYRPTRISKYGTGLALLQPELPSNTWHRTLPRVRAGR
jgi:hypothetical protein